MRRKLLLSVHVGGVFRRIICICMVIMTFSDLAEAPEALIDQRELEGGGGGW